MILPLNPPSFALPPPYPGRCSLGCGQGRAAPAGEAALCRGGCAASKRSPGRGRGRGEDGGVCLGFSGQFWFKAEV